MRVGVFLLLLAVSLPAAAYDVDEILRSPDLADRDASRGEAQDLQVMLQDRDAKLAILNQEYRYSTVRDLSDEETRAIRLGPVTLVTLASKRQKAAVVYWISSTERKVFVFSDQELFSAPKEAPPPVVKEESLTAKMHELDIADNSRALFYEVRDDLEAKIGPIRADMLGQIVVKTFEVASKGKSGELYLRSVTENILAIRYNEKGARIIVGEGVIRYDYPEYVEIRDENDFLIRPRKYKTMTEQNYLAVEAAANKKLKTLLVWSHGYTIDGEPSLKAFGPGNEEYVIIYFSQYLSYVLMYGNKAEIVDPRDGGVYIIR